MSELTLLLILLELLEQLTLLQLHMALTCDELTYEQNDGNVYKHDACHPYMTHVIREPQHMKPSCLLSPLSLPLIGTKMVPHYDIRQNIASEMTMLSTASSNKSLAGTNEGKMVLEILEKAENHCENCHTRSPMTCVEQCDI